MLQCVMLNVCHTTWIPIGRHYDCDVLDDQPISFLFPLSDLLACLLGVLPSVGHWCSLLHVQHTHVMPAVAGPTLANAEGESGRGVGAR